MKTHRLCAIAALQACFAVNAIAAVLYVDVNSVNPEAPYSGWNTASTNIQDAVDAANAGDQILVTNGVYQIGGRPLFGLLTNRVTVTKPVTLCSVNGAAVTTIKGNQLLGTTNGDAAIRCVYLSTGASLVGFTVTGGATRVLGDFFQEQSGGGIYSEGGTGGVFISSCRIVGNTAEYAGGGVSGGSLTNCVLAANIAQYGGGAAFALLNYCAISNNSVGTNFSEGGGVGSCTLNDCILGGNMARTGGATSGGTLNNCILVGNFAAEHGGGAASTGASGPSRLNNCTVVGNSAGEVGGGVFDAFMNNCIIVNNDAPSAPNYFCYRPEQIELNYCCTVPLPLAGTGNITNSPLFVDFAEGNLRIQSESPCINAGNNCYAPSDADLDGRPRIAGGTVDIGAYEFQTPASVISYAWLEQYGLPIDGFADFSDVDGDGMNNWQEWRCGTDPTNAASALRLLSAENRQAGTSVSWQSVPNQNYFLLRGTSLQAIFSSVATNISGQSNITSYLDTNALGPGSFFYRVGVQGL